jgi:hypothetical protein
MAQRIVMGGRGVRRLWAGVLALAVAGSARAEAPRVARLVAPDALFYAEVGRPGQVLDRVTDERLQAVLEAAPGYRDALKREGFVQFRQVVDVVAQQLGTTWDKGLRDLTGGGVVLAVEGKDKPERVFLLVTPGDADFLKRAHAKLLELARQDAATKGRPDPVKESEYRGITGYSVGAQEAHAIVEGTLVVANGVATLKTIIDRALDKSGPSIVDDGDWKASRSGQAADAVAWAFARLDRLRKIDPKNFPFAKADAGQTFLFGPWIEAFRKAPYASVGLAWSEGHLGAAIALPTPPGGYAKAFGKFVPQGASAPGVLSPPGTVASLSLWRDLSAIWEVRGDLLPPEAQQGLAQLDTQAGTFFGGRDFGTGVLGALTADWRLVVARQDARSLDPAPDVKLPAFALVIGLKPEDEEFATRLKAAFQSFIGLVNLGAAQQKAPPLMLGSDSCEGVAILTSKFQAPAGARKKDEPIHTRHNFSPTAAQVGNQFILSSSLGLAKDLIRALKSPAPATDATLVAVADGPTLAGLLEENKDRLVMQNMLEKGNDKAKAEQEIGLLVKLVRYLGHADASVKDRPDSLQFRLDFALDRTP